MPPHAANARASLPEAVPTVASRTSFLRTGREFKVTSPTAQMSTQATAELDRVRIAELTEREQRRLDESTPGSSAMFERARRALAGGVASAYQERQPWPIYLERGAGSRVWDVDGNERID